MKQLISEGKSLIESKLYQLRTLQTEGHHTKPLSEGEGDYPVIICQNCQTEFHGNFCPNCGQKASTKRLDWQNLLEQTVGVFTNLERGFIHTCVELFYRPGYLIRDYFNGHRAEYNRPLSMLFVLATLHLVVHYIFFQNSGLPDFSGDGISDIDVDNAVLSRTIQSIHEIGVFISGSQGLMTLIFVVFLVFPNWLIFKLTPYGRTLNLVEHFHIMLFVGCQLMIFNILQIPYNRFFSEDDSFFVFSSSYSILFSAWDIKQLFQIGWLKSIFYMWLSFMLALFIFILLLLIIIAFYIKFINPELMRLL